MTTNTAKVRLYDAGRAPLRLAVGVIWVRAMLGTAAAVSVGRVVGRVASGRPIGGGSWCWHHFSPPGPWWVHWVLQPRRRPG